MPLWFYTPLHAEARLTGQEKDQLIRGLEATFGREESGAGEGAAREEGGKEDEY